MPAANECHNLAARLQNAQVVAAEQRDVPLLVSSPEVAEPVAVRYAWTASPHANLYGDTGLPVVPFRSDDW